MKAGGVYSNDAMMRQVSESIMIKKILLLQQDKCNWYFYILLN